MEQIPLPPAPSLKKVIVDIFTSPSEAFDGLKDTASSSILWVLPFILTILVVIGSVTIMFTNDSLKTEMREMQHKAMQQRVDEGKMTADQLEQIESRMDSMGSGMMVVISVVGGIVGGSFIFFVTALLLWLADKIILKATPGFGKHLELFGIASWIGILGSVITIFLMAGLGSMAATPSGTLLVLGSYDPTLFSHKVLSALNIFTIWEAVAAGYGLSKFSGKSTGMSIGVSVGAFFLLALASLALGFAR